MIKIFVGEDEAGKRLDVFLADYFEDISRTKISSLIKSAEILVNNLEVKPKYYVKETDTIFVNLESLNIKELEPQELPIDVLYEDDDIAIIDKPVGIVSHPTNIIRENTVVNYLIYRFDKLSRLNGDERPGIVHRLDKNTCGLMIIAKSDIALIKLKEMFKNREIIKKYRAICHGVFKENEGVIEEPIGRNPITGKMCIVNDGRHAKTAYKVLESKNNFSLLDIELFTGRTHQIRVHLAHIKHPILGDPDYSKNKTKFNLYNQLLQAYYLEFLHPVTNEKMKFEIIDSPQFKKYRDILFN